MLFFSQTFFVIVVWYLVFSNNNSADTKIWDLKEHVDEELESQYDYLIDEINSLNERITELELTKKEQ